MNVQVHTSYIYLNDAVLELGSLAQREETMYL